jgi:ferredoxin-nitrate reductase
LGQETTGQAVCPYCGVGCVIQAAVVDNRITKISADKGVGPNYGMLCQKGAYLKDVFQSHDGRLAYPMIRDTRGGAPRRVSWREAIAFVSRRLTEIHHANDNAVGYYGSGQLDTEASYLFTKLFKGSLGRNHTDANSRLCMSSAVAAYVKAFGSDGPPTCYDDIEHADVFLMIGANMAANHPVLFQMMRKRRARDPNTRIIVADPRRTKSAQLADVHVPLAPGSDVAFLHLVAKRLHALGRVDERFARRYAEGFSAYRAMLGALDEKTMLEACDVHPARIDEVVELLAEPSRLLSFYCQGTNQSVVGVDKNVALINLHLQLGEVGKPGSGPFSLTGQPNAMGGREVGYLSHQLPGYRRVADAEHRQEVERHWELAPGSIRSEPGMTAGEMFEAAADGRLKALWIAGTNPAVSMPDVSVAQAGLRRAGLVVVQDCYYPTETAEYADVLLPAAQWGEKAGTMTNSERLVVRSEKFLDPPGEAIPDWKIVARIAKRMGFAGYAFESVEEVWDEYRALTAGRPCDQHGMTNERLADGPLRWPCPTERHPGATRRYARGRFLTDSGKARFHTPTYRPSDEYTDAAFPLGLTTGRIAGQWHTRTRTGKVEALNRQDPEPFVEIHPDDAAVYDVDDGGWVRLVSRRGDAVGKARVTDGIRQGLLFMPFHWGDLYHPSTNVNYVTSAACDPESGQPELKFCAVRVERLDYDA